MDHILFFSSIFFSLLLELVSGHGRLWEPPARSTMWRRGYNTPMNPNDNELNCGGYMNQWFSLSGKCGVCGDPFNEYPRPNEAGGKYATGILSGEYFTGDVIDLEVQLTANHLGYFEFRICPTNDAKVPVTQECLDKYPIRVIGSRDGRYHVTKQDHGTVKLQGKLPKGLSCSHCVLQWRYRSGNRWSCEGGHSGKCGKGLGSQEEFYGCADVAVRPLDYRVPQLRRGNHRYAAAPAIERRIINKARRNIIPTSRKGVNIHRVSDVLLSLLKVVASATRSRGRNVAHIKWDPIGGLYGKDVVQFDEYKDISGEADEWEPRIIEADLPFDTDDHSSFLLSEITSPMDLKTPVRMIDKRIRYPRVFSSHEQLHNKKKVVKSEKVCTGTQKYRHVKGIANWCNVNCRAGNCPAAICNCQLEKKSSPGGNIYKRGNSNKYSNRQVFSTRKRPSIFQFGRKPILPISRPKPVRRFLGKGIFQSTDTSRNAVSKVLNKNKDQRQRKTIIRHLQGNRKSMIKNVQKPSEKRCLAIGKFSRRTMDEWCHFHCAKGFCPASMCKCFK